MSELTLRRLQEELRPWRERNFPGSPSYRPLLGAVEELGELAHAHIKEEQGIRGTPEQHQADAQDAIADVIVFLADYCNARGFDMQEALERTWEQVKKRDWVAERATRTQEE